VPGPAGAAPYRPPRRLLIESRWTLVGLFIVMLLMLELGWPRGRRRLAEEGESASKGLGALEGAVFGLMGLLVAFTFSGSASRFRDRRELILQEANAIGTAWLRLDLLPADARADLQGDFRRYLGLRLEETRAGATRTCKGGSGPGRWPRRRRPATRASPPSCCRR
jgi:hypothetical protein